MPDTARAETSVEYKGAGASQDFGMNYVVGSYRKYGMDTTAIAEKQ
jgi:hypothetical protein